MIDKLLDIYENEKHIYYSQKLSFKGVGNKDVYNISGEFELNGQKLILGRVESRDSEFSCVNAFYKEKDFVYNKVADFVINDYQDPCISFIDDNLIIGGTKIFINNERVDNWKTSFYKGNSLDSLVNFAVAPNKMKDVRLVKLKNGIGIFSRPQGNEYFGGRICFSKVACLRDVNPDTINNCKLIENLFDDDSEWGGANEVHLLNNGLLGVLSHIARFSNGSVRHYYPMTFAFDADTGKVYNPKIILKRKDLPKGDAKRKDLVDVLFSGGINRLKDGKALFYTGASDCEAYVALIDDPFIEYEEI